MRGIQTLITLAVVGLIITGCNTGSENTNTNANANRAAVAAGTPVAGTDANANANTNANDNRSAGLTREQYERDKEKYQREAKQSGRKVGTGVSDGWLWVKARYELAAADDLRDSTINVDMENGVATLTGTVPTAAQRLKAEQVARAVEGVTAVKNLIKVAPPANTNANTNATPRKK